MSVRRRGRRERGEPSDRLRAVLALPESPEALPALMAGVDDPSPDVARAALARLPAVARAGDAGRLRPRLLAVDLAVVRDWAAALCALGDRDETVTVAITGLSAPAPSTRMAAAVALGEIADARAVTALVGVLVDPIAGVRRCALDSLAMLGSDPRSEDACRRRLRDADVGVRCAAVRALCAIAIDADEWLVPALRDPSPRVRRELARHTPALRTRTGEALLADTDTDVRVSAVTALARLPRRDLLDVLVARLRDEAWQVRHTACRAVAATGGTDAVGALVPLLADAHPTVRAAALNVLDETYGARFAAIIGEALPAAGGPLRRSLIYALERCRDADATGLLAMWVDDPDADVRLAVAFVLGELAGEEAGRLLRRMADDTEWTVRCVADGALRRSPSKLRERRRAI